MAVEIRTYINPKVPHKYLLIELSYHSVLQARADGDTFHWTAAEEEQLREAHDLMASKLRLTCGDEDRPLGEGATRLEVVTADPENYVAVQIDDEWVFGGTTTGWQTNPTQDQIQRAIWALTKKLED